MVQALRDPQLLWVFGGVLIFLILLGFIADIQKERHRNDANRITFDNLIARISAWWKMCAIFVVTLLVGHLGTMIVFAVLSFVAMREYMTLVPTRRGDHRALFWSFFVIMPLQYYLVGIQWYGFFAIMIPVLAFIFVPTLIAIHGDTEHFLERSAKIQFGLMVCVYCFSHAPALLFLNIPGFEGHNARLLLYLGIVVEVSDVLQYLWSRLIGGHRIAWRVSPSKTWEGFLGGVISATALGAALWWITPFRPIQAAGMAFMICILGFAGGLVMNAIKRDIGIKDFGVIIEGQAGILDRIDSLSFAAPIFFHLVRYYFVP